MTTAAALIIGDEILTGKVRDENSFVLAKVMFEQGVDLERVVVIPDDIDTIANHVRQLSDAYSYVFTSGGIGPTHDDKTYEAIAKAFDLKLVYHNEALDNLQSHMQAREPEQVITEARKRMALLPDSCEVLWTKGIWVPLAVVRNVYILPGIPSLFELMLDGARERFKGERKERILIFTQMAESDIAEDLSRIQNKFPDVAIGSYPKIAERDFKVMISLEGRNRVRVELAAQEVESAVSGYR